MIYEPKKVAVITSLISIVYSNHASLSGIIGSASGKALSNAAHGLCFDSSFFEIGQYIRARLSARGVISSWDFPKMLEDAARAKRLHEFQCLALNGDTPI